MANDYGSGRRRLAEMRGKGRLPKGPERGAPPVGTKELAGKAKAGAKGLLEKAKKMAPKFR